MMKGAGRARPSPGTGSPRVSCSPSVPRAQPKGRHLLPNGNCSPLAPPAFPPSLDSPDTHPLQTLCCFSWKSHVITVPEGSGQSQPTKKTLLVSFCSCSATEAPLRAFCVLALWTLPKSLCLSWNTDEGKMKLNSSRRREGLKMSCLKL